MLAHDLRPDLRPPRRPLSDDQWTQLLTEIAAHRLEGLLVHAVATDALAVTSEQADQAAQVELDLTHARLWQEQRLIEVVDLIESHHMPVRVLKGLAVATLDYPDPQMRPTGDVDLLVRGTDLAGAGQILERSGATRIDPDPRPGYSETVGKGATYAHARGEIDLHRLLVWGPLGVRLDPDLLWPQYRTFTIAEREMATLSLEDTLLHACCHLLVLGSRRALQVRDVAQLVTRPDLDPDLTLERARRWGAEAVLATAVLLAEQELHLRLGGELGRWAEGYLPTWRDRLWLRVERPAQPLSGIEAGATLLELPSRHARAELVRATLRPTPGTWPGLATRARSLARRSSVST